ncbi:hypothetical protein MKK68_02390 [Methylobacterium sp. E-016]|jgi:hypothetical protein|uniref:hypothetical protein n=1 Tax=unclassified Methylobacterium TaxID=2615210 RepID=UPI001FB9AA5C|nr:MULTISPECIES: hypothetical protein [unclassified Methylobacterium]MCJ2007739.1 hypothetical protein [Methylobacterium sp. J-092]MCJ2074506.1 hypothetical protein [Methylobacterium sp. E-016]
MSDDTAALILTLATEIAELRAALAEAQELLIETAVDAGEMHARLEEVHRELAVTRADRDAWMIRARRQASLSPPTSSAFAATLALRSPLIR